MKIKENDPCRFFTHTKKKRKKKKKVLCHDLDKILALMKKKKQ
jgi:hypothetical protein